MRVLIPGLFLALVVAVCWSFLVAPAAGWWLPRGVSAHAAAIDGLLHAILWIVGTVFVLTIVTLAWTVFAGARPGLGRARFTHGNARLEIFWTVVSALIFTGLAVAQLSTWNSIQTPPAAAAARPFAEVWAQQFEWRFRLAGADGTFGTADDLEEPYELVVPVGEPIVLALRSRDVIHSFFVPSFRLKQDVVPGSTFQAWFEARETGSFDVVCSQLCGFGHYRMVGKIRVVPRDEYERWLARKEREFQDGGREERR